MGLITSWKMKQKQKNIEKLENNNNNFNEPEHKEEIIEKLKKTKYFKMLEELFNVKIKEISKDKESERLIYIKLKIDDSIYEFKTENSNYYLEENTRIFVNRFFKTKVKCSNVFFTDFKTGRVIINYVKKGELLVKVTVWFTNNNSEEEKFFLIIKKMKEILKLEKEGENN